MQVVRVWIKCISEYATINLSYHKSYRHE